MIPEVPRLLVVEDNATLRLLISKQLEILQITKDEAPNGQVAVEKFSIDSYSLVLMDLTMPIVDGLEAAKMMREIESRNPEKRRTPIIGMTAYGDKGNCLEWGMDDFLFKPVLLDQMSQTLIKWLPNELLSERLKKTSRSSYNTLKALNDRAQQDLKESGAELDRIQQRIDDLKNRFGL